MEVYTAYDIIDMVNKCAAPKCQTGYTSSTGNLAFFHFPLKSKELNKNGFALSIRVIEFLQNNRFYANCIWKIFTKIKENARV